MSGARGEGTVVVPLVALPGRRLQFNGALAGVLSIAALILALGLFTIVGATVREGVLPPGAEPDAQRRRRARVAIARAVVIVAIVLVGGGAWWRAEDSAFTRGLFRAAGGSRRSRHVDRATLPPARDHRLRLDASKRSRLAACTSFHTANVADGGSRETRAPVPHRRLMVARRSRISHPSTADTVTFTSVLPDLPAGTYRVFADIVHQSGLTQTLTSTITLTGENHSTTRDSSTDANDSWAVSRPGDSTHAVLANGTVLTWNRNSAPLVAGEEAGLRFAAASPPPTRHRSNRSSAWRVMSSSFVTTARCSSTSIRSARYRWQRRHASAAPRPVRWPMQ